MTKSAIKSAIALLVADDLSFLQEYRATDPHSCEIANSRLFAYHLVCRALKIDPRDVDALAYQKIAEHHATNA